MPKKEIAIKHATIISAYLLIVWGFYRFLAFKLPEEIEELFIKPLIWLLPVFYLVRKEGLGLSSLGITGKNLYPAIYLSIILGIIFALEGILVNVIKYQGRTDFSAYIGPNPFIGVFIVTLVTAISEEVTFRGFVFKRVWHALGSEWKANLITSLVWGLIHVPITFFWWKLSLDAAAIYLLLTVIFGIGSAFVFARTGNVIASILLHIFWGWPIILFR